MVPLDINCSGMCNLFYSGDKTTFTVSDAKAINFSKIDNLQSKTVENI